MDKGTKPAGQTGTLEKIKGPLLGMAQRLYGKRLVSLVVFGSVARGTDGPCSDLDLLLVAKDLPAGRMKRVKEFEAMEEELEGLMRALGRSGEVSIIFKSPEETLKGSPLFLDMVEDARILFDQERFFEKVLERLRLRLLELGSRRIWKGDAWYWDLKPDFRPGEVFEI